MRLATEGPHTCSTLRGPEASLPTHYPPRHLPCVGTPPGSLVTLFLSLQGACPLAAPGHPLCLLSRLSVPTSAVGSGTRLFHAGQWARPGPQARLSEPILPGAHARRGPAPTGSWQRRPAELQAGAEATPDRAPRQAEPPHTVHGNVARPCEHSGASAPACPLSPTLPRSRGLCWWDEACSAPGPRGAQHPPHPHPEGNHTCWRLIASPTWTVSA